MVKKILGLLLLGSTAFGSYSPSSNIFDSSGNSLNSTSNALNVQLQNSSVAVTGTFFQATQPVSQSGTWNVGLTGTLPAFASTPTFNLGTLNGAATAANQTTANTSLASIDSKLTSPLAVTGTFFQTTQPVSGNLGRTWTLLNSTDSVNVGNFPATQAVTQSTSPWVVSGTVTANAGTGTLTVGQSSGANLHVNVDSAPSTTVTGTVTSNQGTSPWVNNISQFGGSNVVTGTGASGSGIPRVTVSNDSNILATQSGAWNIGNVTGTVSLPTGAASSANQTTEITSLASILANQTNNTQSTLVTDPTSGTHATVSASGSLSVSNPATVVFNEPFNGTVIDSTNKWNTPVVAGTATVTQNGASGLVFTNGTTANNAGQISSQPTFDVDGANQYIFACGVQLEATTIATGNHRFWGLGTQGTSYSTSNPIKDGVGFEVTTGGVLRAVIYASDSLVFSQNLTISTNGNEHLYAVFFLGNYIFWYVDSFSIPVAVSGLLTPANTLQPIRIHSLNGSSTTTGTPTLNAFSLAVVDQSRNAYQLSDATYPWRKSTVGSNGSLLTAPIPNKYYVQGFVAASSTTYNNILDPVAGSTPSNVTNYNSVTVTVLSTATTGSYIFEGAWSSDFATGGTVTLKAEEITVTTGASLINAAITPTNATRIFRINTSDVNYFRMRLSTGVTSGIFTADANFTQTQVTPAQIAVVQATGTNLNTAIASGTVTTVSTVSSMTSGNLGIPGTIADVASAALTTTTTTATLTPTFGISYQVSVPVTVVSGTTPTLDIEIQESGDSGTNWKAVYDFPRITATGFYESPLLLLTGNRVRYVQTVGGTTPSFTRSINRLQSSQHTSLFRQLVDRTISLTTLNSTTPSLNTSNCKNAELTLDIGATTLAPVLQLQGSDDVGASWYSIGSTLTSVASATVNLVVPNVNSQLLRAIVSTAGTGTTANYTLVRCF